MTGSELTTLMLRSLGYQENTPQKAAALAILSGMLQENEAVDLTSKKVFLRDDMVYIVYNSLNAKMKGSTNTLLQTLVESKLVSKEAALASGLYSETTTQQPPIPPGSDNPMDKIEEAIRKALKK